MSTPLTGHMFYCSVFHFWLRNNRLILVRPLLQQVIKELRQQAQIVEQDMEQQ